MYTVSLNLMKSLNDLTSTRRSYKILARQKDSPNKPSKLKVQSLHKPKELKIKCPRGLTSISWSYNTWTDLFYVIIMESFFHYDS